MLAAVRRSGRPFARPLALAHGKVRSVAVALGDRGELLVAWHAAGKLHARMRRRGRWDPAETIRSHEAFGARMQAAVIGGRGLIGSTAQYRSAGGAARDAFNQIAIRHPLRTGALLARYPSEQGEVRIDPALGNVAWSPPTGCRRAARGGRLLAARHPHGAGGRAAEGVHVADPGVRARAPHPRGWRRALAARRHRRRGAGDPRTGNPTVVWVQDGRVMTSTRG